MPDLRVVLDTNVLISAALTPHGTPRRVLDWLAETGVLLVSDATADELTTRLIARPKFDRYLSRERRAEFVLAVLNAATWVRTESRLALCTDPDDDRFLEVAADGAADALVTGNRRDFPDAVESVQILTPAEFAALYVPPRPS